MDKTLEEEVSRIVASMDEQADQQQPEPETYHVYPVPGGMVILKEEAEPLETGIVATTLAQTQKPPVFIAYAVCLFYVLLLLSTLAFQVYELLNPPIATITIIP